MKIFKIFAVLVFITFVLHLAWESSHVSLYGGYEELTALPITVWATIGDVLYTLGAVLLVALFKRCFLWVERAQWTDYLGLTVIGFCISVFVEYKAFVFSRWHYLETMPVIPTLDVGLSPVIQMTFLLPLSVFLTWLVLRLMSSRQSLG